MLRLIIGGFELVDADGVVRFYIPTPVMWDSAGVVDVREPETAQLATTVDPLGEGEWLFTFSSDFGWLTDSARVYPVYLDPSAGRGARFCSREAAPTC